MRNYFLSVLCCTVFANAQVDKGIVYNNSNWTQNWTNYKAKTSEYRETSSLLPVVIDQDLVLTKKEAYLLTGNVYVTNGATLTIEPGVIIRADTEITSSLIVTKGSKMIAKGTETDPIVFTSNKSAAERKAGDWGGILIMGEAPTNKFSGSFPFIADAKYNGYGGNVSASNSGVLDYVRIEFAGKKNKEGASSALLMAGVGNKTTVNHVQISFSATDGFSFYGGNIKLNNLIAFRNKGNDYVFNEGTQSSLTNAIAIRNPFIFGNEKSRCLKVLSYDAANMVDLNKGMTNLIAENVTLLTEEGATTASDNEAIFVKENTKLSLVNSVVSGFHTVVFLDEKIKPNSENLSKINIQKNYVNNCEVLLSSNAFGFTEATQGFFKEETLMIEHFNFKNSDFFVETDIKNGLDLQLKFNQKLATGVASNSPSKL